MSTLEICALLPLAFWLLLLLDRPRAWPGEDSPRAVRPAPGEVVALVPARDEAAVLPRTLPALLGQQDPGCDVLLIDDASRDGTAELARRLAAEAGASERLEVVRAAAPADGWTGKVHALSCGLEHLARSGRAPAWLLLTDADILHPADSVRRLLRRAADGFDVVSVMARLHAATFWERLLVPPFVFFFQLLYPFSRVRRPDSAVAAAAGGCVLVRRELLERAGGMAAIRSAVIDDVALARALRSAGGRLWLGLDADVRSLRVYARLSEIWAMVARSAFSQLGYRALLLPPTLAGLALLVAAPPWIAALAAVRRLAVGDPALLRALAWALAAWALQALALLPAVRHHRVPAGWALGLPFAAVLYALMTASSAWSHLRGRGAAWKGRSYGAG